MSTQKIKAMALVMALGLGCRQAHAVLIAEDVFSVGGTGNYTAGSNLNDQNPTSTTGFNGAWAGAITDAYQPAHTNLSMTGVANAGGSLVNNYSAYNATRSISRPLATYSGDNTLWFSTVVQFNTAVLNNTGGSSFTGFLSGALPVSSSGGSSAATWLTANGGTLNGFAWGISKGSLAIRYQSGANSVVEKTFIPSFTVSADTPYLMVAKLSVNSAGNDTLNIWMLASAPTSEATLGTPTLTVSNADMIDTNTDISRLVAFSAVPFDSTTGSIPSTTIWDAIRMGTAFADLSVSAIPEPASMGLLGLGALMILKRKRS